MLHLDEACCASFFAKRSKSETLFTQQCMQSESWRVAFLKSTIVKWAARSNYALSSLPGSMKVTRQKFELILILLFLSRVALSISWLTGSLVFPLQAQRYFQHLCTQPKFPFSHAIKSVVMRNAIHTFGDAEWQLLSVLREERFGVLHTSINLWTSNERAWSLSKGLCLRYGLNEGQLVKISCLTPTVASGIDSANETIEDAANQQTALDMENALADEVSGRPSTLGTKVQRCFRICVVLLFIEG